MKHYIIKNGHDLNLDSPPNNEIINVGCPDYVTYHPYKFKNVKIKLLVKEGDNVLVGSPLFFDKKNEKAVYVSSCSGSISNITFGERRIVNTIEINNDKKYNVSSLDNDLTIDNLLLSGLFTYFRQKPFSKVPDYSSKPKSIFISTMPTEPFAMDYEYLIDSDDSFIQDGIDSLNKLFDCPIYINSKPDSKFLKLDNVIHNTFNKLHPSGNIGIQIHKINPIKDKDDTRWYLSLQDLNRVGEFFKTGTYNNYKYLSIGGNGSNKPAIYKYLIGTRVNDITKIESSENINIISGDVLNGKITSIDHSIGYYDEVLSIIKTDNKREFLGWLMPGFRKYSLTNAFMSKLNTNKNSILTTKLNGSVRTIISMGNWDKVLPMNIMSEFLIKNILAKDIDMMEKLGIYECSPEDFALCSFACQSKVEVSKIIQEGLDLMELEG